MRILPLLTLVALVACTPAQDPPATPSATAPSAPSPAAAASPNPRPAASPVAAAPAASPAPTSTGDKPALESADIQLQSLGSWRDFDRGGGNNVVNADNDRDGRFRARGNAELDRIRGDEIRPTNIAQARASCTDCQTIAVAVQVAVYRRGASVVAPVNRAVAVNDTCMRCVTIARALQYVIPVDDFREVPREVNALVRRVDQEAGYFERIRDLDDVNPREAEERLNRLESDFATLQQYLSDMVDEKEDSTTPATPSPIVSPAPALTVSSTVQPTAVSTATAPKAPTPAQPQPQPASSPAARP